MSKQQWTDLAEAVYGRRSFLGSLGKAVFGLTVALFGFRMSEVAVNANGCNLCYSHSPGCSSQCIEDGQVCSWGWLGAGGGCSGGGTPVCFECFACSIGYCGGAICSEVLCY